MSGAGEMSGASGMGSAGGMGGAGEMGGGSEITGTSESPESPLPSFAPLTRRQRREMLASQTAGEGEGMPDAAARPGSFPPEGAAPAALPSWQWPEMEPVGGALGQGDAGAAVQGDADAPGQDDASALGPDVSGEPTDVFVVEDIPEPVEVPGDITELDTAPFALPAPSRVVRRSSSQMSVAATPERTPPAAKPVRSVGRGQAPAVAQAPPAEGQPAHAPLPQAAPAQAPPTQTLPVEQASAPFPPAGGRRGAAPPAPPWEAITSGATAPTELPAPAVEPPTMAAGAAPSAPETPAPRPNAGYTWLHYLILVVVALVLGLLLWQLIQGENVNGGRILDPEVVGSPVSCDWGRVWDGRV